MISTSFFTFDIIFYDIYVGIRRIYTSDFIFCICNHFLRFSPKMQKNDCKSRKWCRNHFWLLQSFLIFDVVFWVSQYHWIFCWNQYICYKIPLKINYFDIYVENPPDFHVIEASISQFAMILTKTLWGNNFDLSLHTI